MKGIAVRRTWAWRERTTSWLPMAIIGSAMAVWSQYLVGTVPFGQVAN